MTEKNTYYELLKHPEWQKKRLKIMELSNFECENCGIKDQTLHVHHSYYEKGLKPWEYPDESLRCLCDECHKNIQDFQTLFQKQIGKIGFENLEELLGYAVALEASDYPMVLIDVLSYEMAIGIGNKFGLSPETIIKSLEEGKIDGYKLIELARTQR